jgi:hypothetical protein
MSSNRPKEAIGRALITAGSLALLGAAYQRLHRRCVVVWGATREEVANRFPGHELLDEVRIGATRAVTIDVPSEAIWPWLVQMGSGEGSVRMYDWIERLLWLEVRGVDGTTPELSDLDDGDDTRSWPNTSGLGVQVEILTPVGAMTTRSEDGTWVWTFLLVPQDALPRLSSHARASANSPAEVVGWLRWRSERG